jgi:L-lactate dehydrogenase complex protein LldE
VSPSASCVGMVRDQYPKLAALSGDTALAAEVDAIRARTFELTEFLTDRLGIIDVGAYFPHRVTYHPTCHGLRALRLGDRPLALLRAVEGIELVDLPQAEECCGFGGTFAVKNADTSGAMLADKLEAIRATGAQVCTAGDNSCLMHIGGGLAREAAAGRAASGRAGRAPDAAAGARTGGSPTPRALHIAEILASTR